MTTLLELRGAIAVHHTDTVDSPWDGPAATAAMPNDAATLKYCHAWVDDSGDPEAKGSYKEPHHETKGGPANIPDVRNALSRLPQSDIPSSDHSGVESHLQAHLDDFKSNSAREARASRAIRGAHPAREIRRFASAVEVREADSSQPVIAGYASTFDEPYEVSDWLGPYTEEIAPGSFDRTITENDVRYFYNHDGLVLARTKSGTLQLSTDEHGLAYAARVDVRQQVTNDLVIAIGRGDVDQSSFAFEVIRESWNDDYTHRRILEVKLWDVSSVAFPANEGTTSQLNMAEAIEEILRSDDRQLAKFRSFSEANEQMVRDAIAKLEQLLERDPEPRRDRSVTMSLATARLLAEATDL